MKFKPIIPIVLMMSAPIMGMGQNKSGLVMSNLDKTVRPADDFYQFATGGWQKHNPLPAAYSRYGSFDQLQEDNTKRINTILSDLQKKKYATGSIEQKLSDFYKLALDVDRRNAEGMAPVTQLIKEIENTNTVDNLRKLQLKYAPMGYGFQYATYFDADSKNVSMNILHILQSGLTLGQKDYYLNNDSATVAIRNAFRKHIARMFTLYGFDKVSAQKKSEAVFRQETVLALISKSVTELRDPESNYNKMSLKDFAEQYPNIKFEQRAEAEGIGKDCIQTLIVGQPDFMKGLDKIMALQTVDEIKALMEWDIIMGSVSYFSDEIREANFDFFGKTMSGRKEDYPLWKRATNQVEEQLGEALGKIYAQRYFPESSKKIMEQLVANLQVALGQRIDAQSWMDSETKANAHRKLDKFYVKIGYPNKWTDFSNLTIDPSKSFYENVVACKLFAHRKHIADKAGKPVDRDEWYMTPQTVNAYYNPPTNEICFPAGILQYPFFDPKADEAFNYGAIGVVIGHEMTHGFDDKGRLYDADGMLKNWWTDKDAEGFKKRADMYANFFSNIKVLPDLNANGQFTLGENLADHGGLQVSFAAYKNATAHKPLKQKDGFTGDQRFFIAYAGVWGQNITDQEIRNRVKRDPHSLGEWRVNGALPHIDAWYQAFGVKEGDKLYIPKANRLDLW